MISLLHTGSRGTAETQHEEEVVHEDPIVLQSNLPISLLGSRTSRLKQLWRRMDMIPTTKSIQ